MRPKLRLTHALALLLGAALLLGGTAAPLQAEEIDLSNFGTAQDQFDRFVRDLGTGLAYTPVRTPEHSGIIGFKAGVTVTGIELNEDAQYMQNGYQNQDVPSYVFMPRLDAQKGLPFGFEASGYVAGDPNSDIRVFAGSLGYSIMEGSAVTPALTVRGHGSQLFGVDELDLRTYGGDLSISKGFTFITPYAGYSYFTIEGEETQPGVTLDEVNTQEGRAFGGARFSMGWLTLTAQADVGEVNLYSLSGAFHF